MQGDAGQPLVSLPSDLKPGHQNLMCGSEGNTSVDNGPGLDKSHHQTGLHSSTRSAYQRLRGIFKECFCVRAPPADHQPNSSPGSSGRVSGTGRCSHMEGTTILGHIDLTTAMDAMKTIMESIGRDDTAGLRMRMEQLLSSGALRPLTDTLVGHLRHLIAEYGSFTCPEGLATSMSTSTLPQWRVSDQMYAIVERSLRIFLGQLLNDVLVHLHEAETEDNKCGSNLTTSSSYVNVHEDSLSLLAAMLTQEIVKDLSRKPDDESGQRSPSRGFSSVGAGEQAAAEDGKVGARTEGKDHTHINTEGNDYFSLVGMVLVQLMRKIEPTTEDAADFTVYHGDLTEGIVSEFCSASGLLRNEVYPRSIKIEKICEKLYKELLKNFISKDMVHKLLLYRIPVFSTILIKCLVNELLRSVQRDAERDSGCKLFNFLQRFKLCRKVWTAFKRKV